MWKMDEKRRSRPGRLVGRRKRKKKKKRREAIFLLTLYARAGQRSVFNLQPQLIGVIDAGRK